MGDTVCYQKMPEDQVNRALEEFYNISADQIPEIISVAERRHLMYLEDGYYYQFLKPTDGNGVEVDIRKIRKSGSNYLIQYDTYDEYYRYEGMNLPYTGSYCALVEYKEADGGNIWSFHYNGARLPEGVPANVFGRMMSVISGDPSNEPKAALAAYKKLLSEESFDRNAFTRDGEDRMLAEVWRCANCDFNIAYINDDDIPELIVNNEADSDHASGWGQIYTYENGRIVTAARLLSISGIQNIIGKEAGYYERSGYYMNFGMWQGYGGLSINNISNTGDSLVINYEPDGNGVGISGYSINDDKCSEKEFDEKLDELTGGAEFVPYRLYENTEKTRAELLGEE